VAVDGKGNIYVADTLNGRIQKLKASNGKVEAVWGKYATIPTLLGRPGGVAVDPHGDVWITDNTNDRIQVRTPGGRVLAVLGYHGFVEAERNTQGLGQFVRPVGIVIDRNGEVYVADSGNCRVQELAPRGPIGSIGRSCAQPRQFEGPNGVAVDAQGNIYVADTFGDQVFKLSPKGAVLWKYGVSGMGPGQLDTPYGIAVDSHGNAYVSNPFNLASGAVDGRIVKLSPDGKVLDTWGTADPLGQSRFAGPEGLAMDGHDHLFVADSAHNAIQELTTDGQVLAVFPLPTHAQPTGVAVDAKGNIYVADGPNQRVIKLAPTGEVLAIWT
jgi:DNA-binding beta-propeller fold protein YncE